MLVIDTMKHLISETPIQALPPPVSHSQIENRENTSSSKSEERPPPQQTTVAENPDTSSESVRLYVFENPVAGSQDNQSPSSSPEGARTRSQPREEKAVTQQSPQLSRHDMTSNISSPIRPSAIMTNPSTSENIISLSALHSKKHGDHIGNRRSFIPVLI
jgi:hypothetical protein